ncbi:hypothetical protein [Streptomyces cucumeris]|uniref:hypothetical protein n=1 Tax=Streptomyces cucumeris TaxID=2962890 RepID=UPI003EBCFE3C
MGRRREADRGIARGTVRGTALLGLWRAALLVAAVFWVMPSCVHPAAHHSPPSAGCDHHAEALAATLLELGPLPVHIEPDRPSGPAPDDSDNCVAGARGTGQALVPSPVVPPPRAGASSPVPPRTADHVRAPPDRSVHAPGLHELQVLRT